MNEMLQLLAARRSAPPPVLTAPGPSEAQVEQLLAIAARVPDHGKLAPWRFVLFQGAGRERAGAVIAAACKNANPDCDERRLEGERRRFCAPLVVAVVSRAAPHGKIPEWEQVMSAGAVCMNLTVAANAMGFATSWLTEWYAYDRAVLAEFGLAAHEQVAGFIHIGTADEPRADRVRPVLAEIVTRFGV